MSSSAQRPRWIWAALFFFSYLAVHLTVPLKRFFRDDVISLGWTMYAGVHQVPKTSVRLTDGTLVPLKEFAAERGVGRVVGNQVDEARWVPPVVCGEADVKAVEIIYKPSDREVEIPCPR